MGYKKRRHKRKVPLLLQLFLLFLLVASFLFFLLLQYDNKIFATVMEISHLQSKAEANNIIDDSVQRTIQELEITSSDFLIEQQKDTTGISVNTLLINSFCSSVSTKMTQGLINIAEEQISVPLGVITGLDIFSNTGPKIPISLRPMGAAAVDYETSFTSAGINQINFKIWINISMDVKIVTPLHNEIMTVTRKIMLVDTIISGTVPERYMTWNKEEKY